MCICLGGSHIKVLIHFRFGEAGYIGYQFFCRTWCSRCQAVWITAFWTKLDNEHSPPLGTSTNTCPSSFIPSPHWGAFARDGLRTWITSPSSPIAVGKESCLYLTGRLTPSVLLTGLDHSLCHPNLFKLASHISSHTHTLREFKESKCRNPSHPKPLNNRLLTYKQWETTGDSSCNASGNTALPHMYIYLNALQILPQTRSSKYCRCTRGQPPIISAWSWPCNLHPD